MFGHFESFKLNGLKGNCCTTFKRREGISDGNVWLQYKHAHVVNKLFRCKQDVKPSKEMCDFFYRKACT